MSQIYLAFLFMTIILLNKVSGRLIDFEAEGALAEDLTNEAAWHNGRLMNNTLKALQSSDVFLVPNKTFLVMGGIIANNLDSVTIQIDGTIMFSDNMDEWPRHEYYDRGDVLECLSFKNATNITFTSSGKGTLDGQGSTWWGIPGIGYLQRSENRPRLFEVADSKNILVENLLFKDSPYWTFWVHEVDGLEVRYSEITARRTEDDHHGIIDITAFNTDGFDVTGRNVWIHDCEVWDQDDCIAVKDGSEDMLFERITASGIGLTIGSIGNSIVNNITFRDSFMHNTWKGIYMKFRDGNEEEGGRISNVLYENIYMEGPTQFSIWIGPAQQSDSSNLCAAHPCSLCWPQLEDYGAKCEMYENFIYENITLRNITIRDPQFSYGQGVVLGNEKTPMENIVFDGVRVIEAQSEDFEAYHTCAGVEGGIALGDTYPVPPCFQDLTDAAIARGDTEG